MKLRFSYIFFTFQDRLFYFWQSILYKFSQIRPSFDVANLDMLSTALIWASFAALWLNLCIFCQNWENSRFWRYILSKTAVIEAWAYKNTYKCFQLWRNYPSQHFIHRNCGLIFCFFKASSEKYSSYGNIWPI